MSDSNTRPNGELMMTEHDVPVPEGNEVYWERWVDAYSEDSVSKAIDAQEEPTEEELEYGEYMPAFTKPIKTIMTPYGVLPLTEQSLASNHFKFWVGHTNFKLLNSHYRLLEYCDGVESVDIMTPYRFRISIGKLFRDRDIMGQVRTSLLESVEDNGTEE